MKTGADRGQITANLFQSPFDQDPEGASAFYEKLGRLVVLWARFEYNFDATLGIIYRFPSAESVFGGKQIPQPFNARRKLWRKAFRDIPVLRDLRETALKLEQDADRVSNDRSYIIHSTSKGFTGENPLTMSFTHRDRKNGYVTLRFFEITESELSRICANCEALNTRLAPITMRAALLASKK